MFCCDKINDYVYLRVLKDFELDDGMYYERGSIIRLSKNDLERKTWSNYLNSDFFEKIGIIFDNNCKDDEFLPYKKYRMIYFKDDVSLNLKLEKDNLCYFDSFLCKHCNSYDKVNYNGVKIPKYIVNMAELESKTSKVESCSNLFFSKDYMDISKMRKVIDNDLNLYLDFKKHELLDFSCISVNLLLLDQKLINTLSNCYVIDGEEKKNLYLIDFDMFNNSKNNDANLKTKKLVISK